MHAFYLHGFASSATSSKARFFTERLARVGVPVHCPDLNQPDFSTLTTSRMIEQVERAIAALPPGPVALFGSSLGAFVAWHVAARRERAPVPGHPLERLVLLAPALDFGMNRMRELGEDALRHWQTSGWREFFHYGYGEPRRVHYALLEDARRHDSAAAVVTAPTLVFQGRHDALVDASMVRAFFAGRPSATLHELDDDHQLLASLEVIWTRTAAFLGLPAG